MILYWVCVDPSNDLLHEAIHDSVRSTMSSCISFYKAPMTNFSLLPDLKVWKYAIQTYLITVLVDAFIA